MQYLLGTSYSYIIYTLLDLAFLLISVVVPYSVLTILGVPDSALFFFTTVFSSERSFSSGAGVTSSRGKEKEKPNH